MPTSSGRWRGWPVPGTSGAWRSPQPPTPHLVNYVLLVDPDQESVLLCDHRLSGLLLPPGGDLDRGVGHDPEQVGHLGEPPKVVAAFPLEDYLMHRTVDVLGDGRLRRAIEMGDPVPARPVHATYSAPQTASASADGSVSTNVVSMSRSRSGEACSRCSCRKRAGSIIDGAVIAGFLFESVVEDHSKDQAVTAPVSTTTRSPSWPRTPPAGRHLVREWHATYARTPQHGEGYGRSALSSARRPARETHRSVPAPPPAALDPMPAPNRRTGASAAAGASTGPSAPGSTSASRPT